ncbi:hypothetical protein GW17_00035697 [Ensete ventricosum]|nr:hypothetical protein GW17_00035697 [Ensete ventricosum]
MRSQQGGSSDHKENPPEKEEQVTFSVYPRMRVDFPQWEDGDLTGWFSCAKRYFRYHQTPEASMVDIRYNQDTQRTRITTQPVAYKPPAPPTSNKPPQPKKLIREELRDRSTKGLCWHCDKPWNHDHHYKKGRLLLIELIEGSEHEEEDLEHKEEDTKEELQPTDCMVHTLVGYANPHTMKIEGFLKQ